MSLSFMVIMTERQVSLLSTLILKEKLVQCFCFEFLYLPVIFPLYPNTNIWPNARQNNGTYLKIILNC